MKYKLYSYWRSSSSWRVRWALDIKGIPYQTENVNLLESDQYSEIYLNMNPNGRVPTLQVRDITLCGSIAILEYLDEQHPQNPILPSNIIERAMVRELVNIIANDTQPIQNLAVLKYFSNEKREREKFAAHWISRGLKAYEQRLSDERLGFSMGPNLTMADICLIPQVYNAKRFGVDLKMFTKIEAIWQKCTKLDSFKSSCPENQEMT